MEECLLGENKYWWIFGRGNFFQVPTVGFTTFEYTYNIALYLAYIVCVLQFFAYIQKFREKNPQNFECSQLGGTTVRKIYC
eukprot:SAG11_NODE_2692_length_3090_cov_2.761618_3_plen_81_part_00